MRTPTHRFVEWRNFATGEVVENELYDHNSDPLEKKNIYAYASPDLLNELSEQLLSTHPRKGLVMTPTVHSNPARGRLAAKISFENQTDSTISIIPISSKGARRKKQIKRIENGEDVTMKGKLGDVFVVESADGLINEIHSPSIPEHKIVFPPTSIQKKQNEKKTEDDSATEARPANENQR